MDFMKESTQIVGGNGWDDNEGDWDFRNVLEPTPIDFSRGIDVVAKLTTQDDQHLLSNSAVANDIVDALSTAAKRKKNDSSNYDKTKRPRPADIVTSCEKVASSSWFGAVPPAKKKPRTTGSENHSFPGVAINRQPSSDSSADGADNSNSTNKDEAGNTHREKWDSRFQDLLDFRREYGHCRVPNVFAKNSKLAQWVKRQRYQYKLKMDDKHSTITDNRQRLLEAVGFVWDSHEAMWMERWGELQQFFVENGHSNVPTVYPKNRQLSIWVKCQRRQWKLHQGEKPSNMTMKRILKMEELEFNWNPRNLLR